MFKKLLKKLKGTRVMNAYGFFAQTYRNQIDLIQAQRILESLSFPLQDLWKCYMIYRYRVEVSHAKRAPAKFKQMFFSLKASFITPKKILFFPDKPQPFHAMYKLLLYLGYHITSNPEDDFNFAILWWLAYDGKPFAPEDSLHLLKKINQNGRRFLNYQGRDISKVLVNSTFEKTFGYSVSVDPCKYHGQCVMKLNWNALHQGQIIQCPAKPLDGDVVYQRLVNNELENGLIKDMRVPVFGNKIPFVYLKYRSVNNRLVDRVHTALKATIAEADDVLSDQEQTNICRFAREMGLSYCEVDVLRDKDDGRIYIVDANNTPSGPPSPISVNEGRIAVARLAAAFEESFKKS